MCDVKVHSRKTLITCWFLIHKDKIPNRSLHIISKIFKLKIQLPSLKYILNFDKCASITTWKSKSEYKFPVFLDFSFRMWLFKEAW